jgi:sialate O-acetylesterase
MELTMNWLHARYADEFERPADPLLRHYKIDEAHDFERTLCDHVSASWSGCSPSTIGDFSALAYFIGRRLRKSLDVPVGLINASVGGSPIASWMSGKTVADYPEIVAQLDPYRDAEGLPSNDIATKKSEKSIDAIDRWYEKLRWDAHDRAVLNADPLPPGSSAQRASETVAAGANSEWFPLEVPCWFRDISPLRDFTGLLYLKTSVTVPASENCATAALHLGTIVDADTTYINGVRVGHSDYQYLPRDYDIPAGVLREGENEILISVVCERGTGRVTPGKPLQLVVGGNVYDLSSPTVSWEARVAVQVDTPCPVEDFVRWRPTVLYNAMLAPCESMTISSVVWYQGESDTGEQEAPRYERLLTAMIAQWRQGWRQKVSGQLQKGRSPFFVVQLPEFSIDVPEGDTGWETVREAQAAVARHVPDVSLVVGMGCGEWNDLHPADKRGLGEHVAAVMLGKQSDAESASDHRTE